MNEDDVENLFVDVYDIKHKLTIMNDNSIGLSNSMYTVTYDLDTRISNLEKKINEIYSILFNAKRLDLSDLDN
jgi:uncharacterized protein YfkK (UPF0435 family)